MKSETEKAIPSLKNNKAPGPDNIFGEVPKLIYKMDDQFLNTLTDLFNNIYNTGEFPKDCLISVINHIKVFTQVIYNRISRKCEANISESQFGFRNALGTREVIFRLQVLIQRCRDLNKDAFLCFADFAKAFDNIRLERLIEIKSKS